MKKSARAWTVFALLALCACKEQERKPIAGLLAAGASVHMRTQDGERPIAVGSQLMPQDRIKATGPAVLEYFGGALRFLEKGDELEVGDVTEAKLIGTNVDAQLLKAGVLSELPPQQRIIAARYRSVHFTPKIVSGEPTTGDYFAAFFTPNGIENLGAGSAEEGPRKALPPPPHRSKVPHVHAGDLGAGGARLIVDDGFVVAESDDLATAVLIEDQVYELGRTTRLVLPDGAEATLTTADGRQVELEGALDVILR